MSTSKEEWDVLMRMNADEIAQTEGRIAELERTLTMYRASLARLMGMYRGNPPATNEGRRDIERLQKYIADLEQQLSGNSTHLERLKHYGDCLQRGETKPTPQ